MKVKVFIAIRILLGLILLVFGFNKFFEFLPAPEGMSEVAGNYFGSLMVSKTMTLVAVVEILAGFSMLLNKYVPLMAVILMSVSVNAVLFHAVLDPGNIAPALVLLVLNIFMLYGYRNHYDGLLKIS